MGKCFDPLSKKALAPLSHTSLNPQPLPSTFPHSFALKLINGCLEWASWRLHRRSHKTPHHLFYLNNNPHSFLFLTLVVWVGVAIGMAIGRIMEKPPGEEAEVFSSHPEIEKEQLMLWGLQFFERPALPTNTPSTTEFLQTFPRFPAPAPRGLLQDPHSSGGNRYLLFLFHHE
jgi:hypothetical protein